MREVPEWVATHDDQKVPPRVRVRIFERYQGVCYLSGRKIAAGEKWEIEHKIALCNGGEHRESNMAPALSAPHKIKTRADRKEKAWVDARRKSHLGLRKPSRMPGSRESRFKKKISGEVVLR